MIYNHVKEGIYMYSNEQVNNVSKYLKNKFLNGGIDSIELVTTLMAMYRAEKLSEDDVVKIIVDVYMGNIKSAIKALHKTSILISDEDIDQILHNLEKKRPAPPEK